MKTYLGIAMGPGLGLATAERFAREGYRIVLAARNRDSVGKLAEQARANGATVEIRAVDAADPEAVAGLVREVEESFGGIDVLHYNAGVIREATVNDQPLETFNTDLAINVGGALAAIQAVSGPMRDRERARSC